MFKIVYIEITNICGLKCDFCPPKLREPKTMSLDEFEYINSQIKNITKEVAYHIVGDPLSLKNLKDYLDISQKYNLKVNITTPSITKNQFELLNHNAIKQVNFSLNSFNANSNKISLDEYLEPIFEFCRLDLDYFINLRVWNLDSQNSSNEFNNRLFKRIKEFFGVEIDSYERIRLAKKRFLNFDSYFEWPNIDSKNIDSDGFCYGLKSQFGILANGDIVPCCLDKDGVINLGNIFKTSIQNILESKRVKEIKDSFAKRIASESLCKKCSYKLRFN